MIKYFNLLLIFLVCSSKINAQHSDYPSNPSLADISNSPKLVRIYLKELKLSATYILNSKDTIVKDITYKKIDIKATIIFSDNYGSCSVTLSNGDIIRFMGRKKLYRLTSITVVDAVGKITIKKVKEYLPLRKSQ